MLFKKKRFSLTLYLYVKFLLYTSVHKYWLNEGICGAAICVSKGMLTNRFHLNLYRHYLFLILNQRIFNIAELYWRETNIRISTYLNWT